MKEPYTESPASYGVPESCVGARKDAGEALTGECIGEVSSREILTSGCRPRTVLSDREGNTTGVRHGECVRDPARSQTLCICGRFLNGNRGIPCLPAPRWWGMGRVGKTEVASRR